MSIDWLNKTLQEIPVGSAPEDSAPIAAALANPSHGNTYGHPVGPTRTLQKLYNTLLIS